MDKKIAGISIPELEHFSGSWIMTRKTDGSVIGEFYNRDIINLFNSDTCRVETALQYLCRINRDSDKHIEDSITV